MKTNAFEEKLNTLIEQFIQKNRVRMFLGSAQMHEPIRLYLLKTLGLSDNYTLQIPSSYTDAYLNFQVPKLLSLLETCCENENRVLPGSDAFLNNYEHPWKTILEDYVYSTLAYVENESDMISVLAILKNVSGIKILFSNKNITTDDIELTDDYIFFHLDVTHLICVDNPYLRICFYNIFNLANSMLWFLRFLCPKLIYVNSGETVEACVLASIATSLAIPIKTINNG